MIELLISGNIGSVRVAKRLLGDKYEEFLKENIAEIACKGFFEETKYTNSFKCGVFKLSIICGYAKYVSVKLVKENRVIGGSHIILEDGLHFQEVKDRITNKLIQILTNDD